MILVQEELFQRYGYVPLNVLQVEQPIFPTRAQQCKSSQRQGTNKAQANFVNSPDTVTS